MSVSFQARADDVFQTLDYPSKKKKTVSRGIHNQYILYIRIRFLQIVV